MLLGVSVWLWLFAFVAMALLDVSWVLYMRAANKNHPFAAASWAVVLHAFGAVAVLSYVDDPRYLSATILGTFVGTFGVVRWTKHRDNKKKTDD